MITWILQPTPRLKKWDLLTFGITADNEFVTPLSPSILPSITKYSCSLAEHQSWFDSPIEGDVPIDNLDRFVEIGAVNAVISPIGGVQHGDDFHVFYSETEVGPYLHGDELTWHPVW